MGIAVEAVEFLAATYQIPRHTVELVAEGYDPFKRQTWAVTQAPYMTGVCRDVAIQPIGAEIAHNHAVLHVAA